MTAENGRRESPHRATHALTDKTLNKLAASQPEKLQEVMDPANRGFGVRVHPNGTLAFLYRFRTPDAVTPDSSGPFSPPDRGDMWLSYKLGGLSKRAPAPWVAGRRAVAGSEKIWQDGWLRDVVFSLPDVQLSVAVAFFSPGYQIVQHAASQGFSFRI